MSAVAERPSLHISVPTFRYNGVVVLRSIEVSFPGAGLAALIGPNGSGKSTLLRIAAGLVTSPDAMVSIAGRRIRGMARRELAAWIAWVPQRADLLFAMTVREMVRVGRYRVERPLRPLPDSEEQRIESALGDVGLAGLAEREVETLSGGEWQRAMIARAVVQDTPILLLDEPIASLDLRYQDEIYALLRRLAAAGRLVLVADHHLEVAAAHAERLILLREGRIAGDGSPSTILTADRIEETFGVRAQVFADPFTGKPRLTRPGIEP